MKKLICVLMIVALMATFMVVSAFAAEDAPQLVVSSAEAINGEEIVLTISVVNNPGISNGKILVTYDEEAMELVKIAGTIESAIEEGGTIMGNVKTGEVAIVLPYANAVDMPLVQITLKVKDTTPAGTYEVGVVAASEDGNLFLITDDGANVDFEVVSGTVEVAFVCQHTNVIHNEAIEPGCHYNGRQEHWFCPDCEGFWADEELTQVTNSKNVVIAALGGEVVHVEAVAPTCYSEGNIEHWYCEECEQVWQDEALTQLTNRLNVKLGTIDHNIVHMEAVEPGCHFKGHIEHWYCTMCETVWADEALTQLTNHMNVIVPELGGDVIHVEAKAPTCTEDGNIEYWYCEECMQVWQDEARTQLTNIKNVVVPAAHTFVDGVCVICGEKAPAATGDFIYVAVATALVSMLGIVALTKKKEF